MMSSRSFTSRVEASDSCAGVGHGRWRQWQRPRSTDRRPRRVHTQFDLPARLREDRRRRVRTAHALSVLRLVEGRGLGGTRTALPPHRDGFTPHQIDLGRYLFFDPVLSGDGTLSCASCHDPARGLSDGRARSTGIHGADAGRAAPTLWNVAFLKRFFWDARADSLEAQAAGPLYSPREMGNTPQTAARESERQCDLPSPVPAKPSRAIPAPITEQQVVHGAHRFRDLAGLPQQPLRPLRPRIRRRALRA